VKTKTTKSEVRDLVLKVREGLGRRTGKARASRDATARALGVSPGTIYNWECGNSLPTRRLLEDLKRAAVGATPDAGGTSELESLADMIRAIARCGDRERARKVFERAMQSISS
jgi:transcriptional regulator with XRE-family HTH domain